MKKKAKPTGPPAPERIVKAILTPKRQPLPPPPPIDLTTEAGLALVDWEGQIEAKYGEKWALASLTTQEAQRWENLLGKARQATPGHPANA